MTKMVGAQVRRPQPKLDEGKRGFLKTAGAVSVAAMAAGALVAPAVRARAGIKWRLQTYAAPTLAEHVIKPSIDAFNRVANGEMEIELYTLDQTVPTGELFEALQRGEIDAVQSDEDSMAAPVDVSVFGGYFPFATRYSLDVPVLFDRYGLAEIWREAYDAVENVVWLGAGAWDPCNLATVEAIRSLADLEGKRIIYLSDGRLVPVPLRCRPRRCAVRRGRRRRDVGSTRRRGLVGYHRGLHGGLGRCDQLIPDEQHLGRLDRLLPR